MDNAAALAITLLLACITFFTRLLPFLLFKGSQPPKILAYIGGNLPPAVMIILVLYCLKDVRWLSGPHGLPELIGIAVVTTLHAWRGNVLLSIGGGTITYMVLVRLFGYLTQ
jgi:branched-subunit amino acid transport protein AzlD